MTLWFRFLWLLLTAPFKARLPFDGVSVLHTRVWLNDVDLNIHMSNARYNAVMDLGRTDLLIRTGLVGMVMRDRLQAVVGASMLRWRKGLAPLQPYRLESRVVAWDDKWFWMEQKFITRTGIVACIGMVKGCFTGRNGVIAPDELASRLGVSPDHRPPVPDWTANWDLVEIGALERKTGPLSTPSPTPEQ